MKKESKEKLLSFLWFEIEFILQNFVLKMRNKNMVFRYSIGSSSNDVFIFRGWLSLFKDDNGDEISISIDIKKSFSGIEINSDICSNDGLILANGPIFSGKLERNNLTEWISKFEFFLCLNFEKVTLNIKNI